MARLLHVATLSGAVGTVVWVIVTWVTRVNPVDFLVYRYGAEAVLHGADVYAGNLFGPMMPVGGMPFTYTPFAAVVLSPTVLFDPRTAYLLWSVLSVGVIAWAVDRFVPHTIRRRTPVVAGLVVLLSATTMVTQHISFGQINLPLMGLVLADVLRTDTGRVSRILPRGLLVGAAAAIKLTPALFVIYFLSTRQWKAALWSAVGGVGGTLLALAILPGTSIAFWSDVIWTLDTRVDFGGGGFASYGNNSLQGILAAAAPAAHHLALPLVLVAGVGALVLARRVFRQGRPVDAALIVGLAAPLLSPISWIHHWVYIIPAVVVLIFRGNRQIRVTAIVIVALLIPGPGLGDLMIPSSPLLTPLGWVMRESLAIASLLCIGLLTAQPPLERRRPPAAPEPLTLVESRTR